ncbi:RNA ligase [Acinetobacter phage Acj9]|uniref:Anti-CBASS protein Acb1 n=1 Tax=Acinetobacter phage Acj9 TaxID=760939 RepID=E5EPT7_9CAUD|nr:RNA ligase [Acinetobacter phage Acj9]ADG60053.1 conserved hypothetical protein [Acinetobacter phage Acj9]
MHKQQNNGTYAAVKFTAATLDMLQDMQRELQLFEPVPRDKLHSTICFSRVNIPYAAINESRFIGTTGELEIFEHNGKRALVLLLESDYLKERHKYSRILGATYDFDEYRPHITLAYDIGARAKPGYHTRGLPVEISHEYSEDLDLNWKP